MTKIKSGPATLKRLLVASLCSLLISQLLYAGQNPASSGQIKIIVVRGADAKNVAFQITAKSITVQIKDANDKPISDAQVEFAAPESGPGGEFASDSRTITVVSDSDGFASAGPYHPNAAIGAYDIRVRATYQGMTSVTSVPQANVASRSRLKLIAVIALAAGVVVAAIVFHHGGASAPAATAPTITFGTIAVGAP